MMYEWEFSEGWYVGNEDEDDENEEDEEKGDRS